jgi:apolipoprotein N-acyltransferase
VDGREPITWSSARRDAILVGTAALIWVVASVSMLDSSTHTTRVATIQPGVGHELADGTWERTPQDVVLKRQIAQTRKAAAAGATLITWHEAGFHGDARGREGRLLSKLADELNIYLTVGWSVPRVETGGRYNEVAAFNPNGDFLGTYGKSHIGDFAGDAGIQGRKGFYAAYKAPFGKFGTIICFDLDFTNSARSTARSGSNVLAVSSSDPPGIEQKHSTHMVFRAIETGQGVLKADSLHDSIVVDPWGRIVDYKVTMGGGQTTLVADLPIRAPNASETFYTRWGEWFGFLCLGLVGLFMLMSAWLRRKDRLTASLEGAADLRIGMQRPE